MVSALLSTHLDNSITSQSFDSWASNQKCALLPLEWKRLECVSALEVEQFTKIQFTL